MATATSAAMISDPTSVPVFMRDPPALLA
jgi:hypothetical protein